MSSQIERPLFYEGQILGAADLEQSLEYARNQQARHERFLHLWGIADGLKLTGKKDQTADGVEFRVVTLSSGVAIDGTGREVVVAESEALDDKLFDQSNVALADTEAFYPVFLVGRDEPVQQTGFAGGSCSQSQANRSAEGFEVTFGRPGDELDLDTQTAPEITDGPASGAWKILLGFVQWDATIKRFNNVVEQSNGIGRRYAGVQADVVAARAGKLALTTRSSQASGKPALTIDESENGLLQFGLLTDQGSVTPVFSVNSKGDVEAKGTIKGAVAPGSVQIQSGIAFDGVVLPLPPGITVEQVAEGKVALHTQLSAFVSGPIPGIIDVPFEMEIEPKTLRVLCRFRRVTLSAPSSPVDMPGACNYIVLAAVPAA